jgi:hypothetical protein
MNGISAQQCTAAGIKNSQMATEVPWRMVNFKVPIIPSVDLLTAYPSAISPAGRVVSDQPRHLRPAQRIHLHDVAPHQASSRLALPGVSLPDQNSLRPAIELLAVFGLKPDFLAASTNRPTASKLNLSALAMGMTATQRDRPFKLFLCWNQLPHSGPSRVGRESDCPLRSRNARIHIGRWIASMKNGSLDARSCRLRGLVPLALLMGCALGPSQQQLSGIPPQLKSQFIVGVKWDLHRYHAAAGDTWPLTWASDGNLYGAAGDNQGSPMNFWRIEDRPPDAYSGLTHPYESVFLVNNLPVNCKLYCNSLPGLDLTTSVKPAGLISVKGVLYFAVENMNYGDNPQFNRQHNVNGWIITSNDFGKTWKLDATERDFFVGRVASAHFIQFGKDNIDAPDEYVYAYFPAADDGKSYWENGDYLLLGRVPRDQILLRSAWKFFAGRLPSRQEVWDSDETKAVQVFRYPHMTGEDHVTYNPVLKRYILVNYGFHDAHLNPRPYHQESLVAKCPSQLTLFESSEMSGPWSLFYRNDDFGTCGEYNPSFPQKWMSRDGKTMWMVSSGSYDDYNFVTQKVTLVTTDQ